MRQTEPWCWQVWVGGVGDLAVAAAWSHSVFFQLERGANRQLCHCPVVPPSCGVFCHVHHAVAEFLRCVDIDLEAPFKGQTPAELARAQTLQEVWDSFDICDPDLPVSPGLAELRDSASHTIAETVSGRVGGFLLLAGLTGRPPISLATDVSTHLYTLQWCRLPGRASNALVPVAEDLGSGRRSSVSASSHYCRCLLQATPGAGFRATPTADSQSYLTGIPSLARVLSARCTSTHTQFRNAQAKVLDLNCALAGLCAATQDQCPVINPASKTKQRRGEVQ
jgi:hypothetical protein